MLFKIIAVFILLTFYSCYFIKLFLQRRKGIRTDYMGIGKRGVTFVVEILLKCASIIVLVAETASILLTEPRYLSETVRFAGAAIGMLGTAVFICSVVTMKDSWRAGVSEKEKTKLVTGGIYKFSRNPAFFGFYLVYAGIVCMFFNGILFGVTLFAIVIFHFQIVFVEEPFLSATFGDEYVQYTKKVSRYFGRKFHTANGREI